MVCAADCVATRNIDTKDHPRTATILFKKVTPSMQGARELPHDSITRTSSLSRISRAPNWIDARKPLLLRWQSGEGSMRFLLVPVSDREEIVGAMVGMAVLDRRPERFGERDWRIQVKAIYGRVAARNLGAFHRCSE